jgi:hypothetical protein
MNKKHLQKYIDRVCFRFNNRDNPMQVVFEEVTRRVAKKW